MTSALRRRRHHRRHRRREAETRSDTLESGRREHRNLPKAHSRSDAPRAKRAVPIGNEPVDVITYVTLKLTGLPSNRVLGSGDRAGLLAFSLSHRQALQRRGADVHAYIVGEHGDSETPLWSSASIATSLHEWAVPRHGKLTIRDRTEIFQNVKDAARQVIAGKGATNYAIGLSTARSSSRCCTMRTHPARQLTAHRLLRDKRRLPVSPLHRQPRRHRTAAAGPDECQRRRGNQSGAEQIKAAIKSVGF